MVLAFLTDELIDAIHAKYGDVTKLNLSSNGLRNIEKIEKLVSLQRLNLSCNQITDLYPLSKLLNLDELDLRENNIEDIKPLGNLLRLRVLDLSGNNISNFLDLLVLQHIQSLITLDLRGNPICLSPSYPTQALEALPQLKTLDGRGRSEILDALAIQKASPSPDSLVGVEEGLSNKIIRLERQLTAMETAFVLQEKALSVPMPSNALEVVRLQCQRAPVATPSSTASSSPSAVAFAPPEIERAVLRLPYTELLSLWRHTALKEMINRRIADQQLRQEMVRMKTDRRDFFNKLQEVEALCASWKERSLASQSMVVALRSELQGANDTRDTANHRIHTLSQQISQYKQSLWAVRVGMEHARTKVLAEDVRTGSFIAQMTGHLESFEKRITAAAQRLGFVAGLLAQKEVSYRNSLATVEADKRLWELSIRNKSHSTRIADKGRSKKQGNLKRTKSSAGLSIRHHHVRRRRNHNTKSDVERTSSKSPSASGEDSDDGVDKGAAGQSGSDEKDVETSEGSLEGEDELDVAIRPEVESVLRALFRQLDLDDSGRVKILLLLRFLSYDADEIQSDDDRVIVPAGSEVIHNLLEQTLGGKLLSRIIRELKCVWKRADDCTWGEFLLCLIPTAQLTSTTTSSHSFKRSRTRLKPYLTELYSWLPDESNRFLFEDKDWAMVPLDVTAEYLKKGKAETGSRISHDHGGHTTRKDEKDYSTVTNDKEFQRLARERSYLLNRLQFLVHNQLRRDADVAQHFRHVIRKSEIREERLRSELSTSKSRENELTSRLAELQASYDHLKDSSEKRIKDLSEELEILSQEITVLRDREYEKEGQILTDERNKFARLDSEYRLLKREATRSEVRCKALQRDLTRLQQQLQEAQLRQTQRHTEKLPSAPNPTEKQEQEQQQRPQTPSGQTNVEKNGLSGAHGIQVSPITVSSEGIQQRPVAQTLQTKRQLEELLNQLPHEQVMGRKNDGDRLSVDRSAKHNTAVDTKSVISTAYNQQVNSAAESNPPQFLSMTSQQAALPDGSSALLAHLDRLSRIAQQLLERE